MWFFQSAVYVTKCTIAAIYYLSMLSDICYKFPMLACKKLFFPLLVFVLPLSDLILKKLMDTRWFCNFSWWGWDGSAQADAGGGDSMEESVHGGAQCKEYAGGGSVQLGEVQLHRGLFTGLAGRCRGSSKPARKHKEGRILVPNVQGKATGYQQSTLFCC